MSAQKQREADVAFLRQIVAETHVGSAKVTMAVALDRLEKEPLVAAETWLPKPKPKPADKPTD